MAQDLELLELDPSLAEARTLAEASGSSLLDAIHQRWLERTSGDDELVTARLHDQVASDDPDEEACLDLLDGYVAVIGKGHVGEGMSEEDAYTTGRRAVLAYLHSTAFPAPAKLSLWDIIGVIEDAPYESGELSKPPQPGDDELLLESTPTSQVQSTERGRQRKTTPPQLTREQLLQQLEVATARKTSQAEIRAEVRQGSISLEEALDSPAAKKMTIGDLLIRVPKIGKVKREAALKKVGLAESSEVGTLTDSQRSQLIDLFPPEKHQPDSRSCRPAPDRKQSEAALKRANEARIYRAKLRIKLAAGEITVEEILADPVGSGMKLAGMLLKLPTQAGVNNPKKVRSAKLRDVVLADTELPGSAPLNKLTERQQKLLLRHLAARYNEQNGTYTYSDKL